MGVRFLEASSRCHSFDHPGRSLSVSLGASGGDAEVRPGFTSPTGAAELHARRRSGGRHHPIAVGGSHWFHWSSFIVHVREFRPQSATVGGDERIAGLILLFGFRGITFSGAPVPLPMIAGYEVVVNYRFRSER